MKHSLQAQSRCMNLIQIVNILPWLHLKSDIIFEKNIV